MAEIIITDGRANGHICYEIWVRHSACDSQWIASFYFFNHADSMSKVIQEELRNQFKTQQVEIKVESERFRNEKNLSSSSS